MFLRKRFLAAEVTIHSAANPKLIVVSIHLPYIGYVKRSRLTNALYLIRQLRDCAKLSNLPLCFCGDFNVDLYRNFETKDAENYDLVISDHEDENLVDGIGYWGK